MAVRITSATEVLPGTQPALNAWGGSGPCGLFGSAIKSTVPLWQAICLRGGQANRNTRCLPAWAWPGICTREVSWSQGLVPAHRVVVCRLEVWDLSWSLRHTCQSPKVAGGAYQGRGTWLDSFFICELAFYRRESSKVPLLEASSQKSRR